MTRLLLSTGNIMGEAASMGYSKAQRSNTELTSCLRANFQNAITDATPMTNGNGNGNSNGEHTKADEPQVDYKKWTSTSNDDETLYIPAATYNSSALQEEREQYDITVKLFYLPGLPAKERLEHTRRALDLVLKELKVPSINLLIVSFPGIYFDEESEDCPDKIKSRGPVEMAPEPIESQIETWHILEQLHDEGLVAQLGLSEFGTERLHPFLDQTRIRPSVDQINLRDCCSVPKPLLTLAKTNGIELLVHNDCTNVLPRGTLRELLGHGEHGAGVLAFDSEKAGEKRKEREDEKSNVGLPGQVEPRWVVKYTAVVQNRGVVENKGYFAEAELLAE